MRSCPVDAEDRAEALYLGHLSEEEARDFRAHMSQCSACTRVYREVVDYIEILRAAAKLLEDDGNSKPN